MIGGVVDLLGALVSQIRCTDILLISGVTLLINYAVWKGWFSSVRHPPSYYGVPFLGVFPFLIASPNILTRIKGLVDKNGPIIRLRIGWKDLVIINKAGPVKDALKDDNLLGRPHIGVFDYLQKMANARVFLAMEGHDWKEVRNHSVSSLRDLGFGKTPRMEEHIQMELREFIKVLEDTKGASFNFKPTLVSSVSNNIATLLFGERLPYDNPKRKVLSQFLTTFIKIAPKLVFVSLSPFLFNLFQKMGTSIMKEFERNAKIIKDFIDSESQEHQKNFVADDKKDLLDYMIEAQKTKPVFSERVIRGSSLAYFGAGSNTVRASVEYLLQLAAAYPEVQQEMFEEIEREIGLNKNPEWSDNEKLHLVKSFIDERMRHYTVAPLGVFRKCIKDTKLHGYDIKEGTYVIYNLNSVHYDEEVFEDPQEFKPKRFLDANGRYVKNNNVIPFAIGKRACPGETFAVFEIFLYFVSILQRFKIELDEKFVLRKPEKFLTEPQVMNLRFISRS